MTKTLLKQKLRTPLSMKPIHQDIFVTFSYDVHFTKGLFESTNSLLAQVIASDGESNPKRVVAVVDSGLIQYNDKLLGQLAAYFHQYKDILSLETEPVIVPGGETVKNNPEWVSHIHQIIHETGLCRHSYVMGIGGGAVLDMVGYAAATAHRGIRLIRVPTTVLAQNDSGVGVKNSINAFGKKNFLGVFAPPTLVLNDFDFLTTLDERDWRSGIAEAVKVALIKDLDFYNFINMRADALTHRDMGAMQQLIYRCSQLHLEHIASYGDPFEMGSSRPLDFGHWAAHKLEHLTNYTLRHGEAVAIGIALDSTYSYLTGSLSELAWQSVLNTLKNLGFKVYVSALAESLQQPNNPNSIFSGLAEFREHLGGELTLMLLKAIGEGIEVHQVDLALYEKAISMLRVIQEKSHPIARGCSQK